MSTQVFYTIYFNQHILAQNTKNSTDRSRASDELAKHSSDLTAKHISHRRLQKQRS